MQGADLLEAGFELEEVLEMCVYKGLNSDTKNKLMKDIDFKDVKKANKIFKPKKKKDIVEINIDFDNGEYNVKGLDKDMFSKLFDSLKVVHESSIVVLANVLEERIQLIAYVSKNLIPTYNAGKIIKDLTAIIGGSGGGRPDVAQGGGKDASKISEAFDCLKKGF